MLRIDLQGDKIMSAFKINCNIEKAVYKATADINKYNKETREKIINAVTAGVKAVAETAIRLAPAGATGNLKAGIKHEMKKGAYGEIKSTANHSHLVEFGSTERIVYNRKNKQAMVINGEFVRGDIYNGKMPAKPFMKPAIESEKPKIEESIKKIIE